MDASAAATQDGKLQDALSQMEAMRQPRESGSSRAGQRLLSLNQLIIIVSKAEILPMQYEIDELQWEACAPMQGGNPKQRSNASLVAEN